MTVNDQYHDDSTNRGYRFSRHGRSLAIERAEETETAHVAARPITPFSDVAGTYDVTDPALPDTVLKEWNRRRRTLGRFLDEYLDDIDLPNDRIDGFRCWTDSETPHLIVRYGKEVHDAITGTGQTPLPKYAAIGRGQTHDRVVLGNVILADTFDELAGRAVQQGLGVEADDLDPDQMGLLIKDLDAGEITDPQYQQVIDTAMRAFNGR